MDTNNNQIIIEEKNQKQNEEIVVNKYLRGNLMGKGGDFWVEFTHLETQKLVAAQIIEKKDLSSNKARKALKNRIQIQKRLNHENVQKFEHVFKDSKAVYLLVEHQSNESLVQMLRRRKRLTEPEVQYFLLQMVAAIKYVHSKRVIHRDVKLENFRLSEKMQIKLAGFQLAVQLEIDDERDFTLCGSPNYIAPEILSSSKPGYSYEVDIWSLGVCIYALLIGKPAFETSEVTTTYTKIRNCDYNFPKDVNISEPARDLITRILNKDPHRRPTLDNILNSSFLNPEGTIPQSFTKSILSTNPYSGPYCKVYYERTEKTPEEFNNDFKETISNQLPQAALINPPSTSLIKQLKYQNTDQISSETKNDLKERLPNSYSLSKFISPLSPSQIQRFEPQKTQKVSNKKIPNQQCTQTFLPSTSEIKQLEHQNTQKSSKGSNNDKKEAIPKYLPQYLQTYSPSLFQIKQSQPEKTQKTSQATYTNSIPLSKMTSPLIVSQIQQLQPPCVSQILQLEQQKRQKRNLTFKNILINLLQKS